MDSDPAQLLHLPVQGEIILRLFEAARKGQEYDAEEKQQIICEVKIEPSAHRIILQQISSVKGKKMTKRVFLALAFLFAVPASATTYYIDYAAGSNANNGTAKATPWKSHPYMQNAAGCAGAPHSYVHVAGDQFIFKGGVSWPAACFQMNVTAGGSSAGVMDYYGVDLTWFSGTSFTRPKFNLANTAPSANGGLSGSRNVVNVNGSFTKWDNIEVVGQFIIGGHSGPNSGYDCGIYFNATSGHLVINSFFHDWVSDTTNINAGFSNCAGGLGQNGGGYTVDSSTFSGQNSMDLTRGIQLSFGGCFQNASEVKNSTCHHVAQGAVGFSLIHDSQFYNLSQVATISPYTNGIHSNVIHDTFPGGGRSWYNNLIHDNSTGSVATICPTGNVYNNVMWANGGSGGGGDIRIDTGINACTVNTSTVANIYNNTVDCSDGISCLRIMRTGQTIGTVNMKNNHWITNGTPVSNELTITNFNQSNNITMPTATATIQGYTVANKYKPTASTNGTVNYGTNLTTLCGSLTALCSDANGASWSGGTYDARPANTGSGSCGGVVTTTPCWDAGAYRYPTSNAIPISFNPNPVAFGNVNIGSSSSIPVTVTNNSGVSEVLSSNASVTGTDFSIVSSSCTSGLSIPPSGTCAVTVRCTPTASVSRSGSLNIMGTNSASVSLSCTGTNAISIPSTPTGLTAVASGSSVTLNWTASTGTPTGYNCQKGTVSGGPYTTFASPSGIGCVASGLAGGTYYFVVNAFNSAGTSANSSEANATVVTPVSSATFSPANLQFDNVVQGVASVIHTVTVTSSGTANLVLASSNAVSISGPNAADFSVSGATCTDNLSIVPGNNCTISVIFTPSTTTSEIASLVIVSNDPNSPDTITLTGTGVSPVTISPTSINFGNVFRNRVSTAQVVTYTNNSGASITFSSVAISTGDSTQFTLGVNTCVGVLTNGSSCTASLTFTPNSNGQKTSALVFTDNSTGSPRSVTLTGKATSHKVLKIGAIVKYQPPSGVQIINAIWKGKRNQTKETI